MKIRKWHNYKDQMCNLGKHHWSVARLIKLAENLTVFDAPVDALNIWHCYEKLTLRDMVMHFNAVNNANLYFPIILDEDGDLMDGRHRIMKAIMLGHKTIKAVRFDENPEPCKISD
jgi:hypothetical protein